MRRAVPRTLRRTLGRRSDRVARAKTLRRALARRARAAAGRGPAFPVSFTASGSVGRFDGGLGYGSGATDLLSLASLLLPGQRIPIVTGSRWWARGAPPTAFRPR